MPAGTRDYYEVLGVDRNATTEEIKRAFRRKARECHPDVSCAPDAEERFKELNEAYDVLSDPEKRAHYDRFGTVQRPGSGGFGGGYVDFGEPFGFDLSDLFSAFFGGVSGAARGVRHEGRDMVMTLAITLEEAATGVEREILVDRLAPCDVCGGTGAEAGTGLTVCPDCRGSGQRVTTRQTFLGVMQTATPCPRCHATGRVLERPCDECQGSGRVPDRQRVTVTVPPGIRDGQQVRLRGMGEAGIRGAAAGDLLIQVRVAPHEYLHREGDDLHCKITIPITRAALGGEVVACGLLEDNTIRIPPGTQHGDTIRLKGKGMPRMGSAGRGDLIVHVGVEVPRKLTKRQRELLERLADEFGDERGGSPSPLEKLKNWLTG